MHLESLPLRSAEDLWPAGCCLVVCSRMPHSRASRLTALVRASQPLQIWSTKEQDSLAQIDMKANVCCVKYNPASSHEVAIGSADHCVHVYDLRRADRAVHVLAGTLDSVSVFRYQPAGSPVLFSKCPTAEPPQPDNQACADSGWAPGHAHYSLLARPTPAASGNSTADSC